MLQVNVARLHDDNREALSLAWVAGRDALPEASTRSGYHLAFWRVGNLEYCAVSDAGWDELRRLERLLRDLGAREQMP